MMIGLRVRRFSLMMLICLCACSALLMSGYRGAADQIVRRKRMLQQIAGLGGKVQRGRVRQRGFLYQTPEGLTVPDWIVDSVGDAVTQSVTSITVPASAARPGIFGGWMLDDIDTISLTNPVLSPEEVDHRTIAVIPRSAPLYAVHFGDNIASARCIEELTKFNRLNYLDFAMNGQPLPMVASNLQAVARLSTRQTRVDKSTMAALRKIAFAATSDTN